MDTHHLFKCKGTFVGHAVSSLQHSPTIHTVLSIPHTVLITPTVPLVNSPQHPYIDIDRHSICTCVHCTCRLWWLLWLCCSGPSVGIMCGGRHAIQCLLRQYHQGGGKLLPVLSSLLSSLSPPSSLPYSLCYIHTYIHFKVLYCYRVLLFFVTVPSCRCGTPLVSSA